MNVVGWGVCWHSVQYYFSRKQFGQCTLYPASQIHTWVFNVLYWNSAGVFSTIMWFVLSLLLEISPPFSSFWDSLTPESAFETAVHSPLDRQDVQTLWTEYLFYQRDKALRKEQSSPLLRQSMSELVNRCLMSVCTSSSLPHSSSSVWQDYRFHNQVSGHLV